MLDATQKVPCPKCLGDGDVESQLPARLGGRHLVTCSTCHGEGEVDDEDGELDLFDDDEEDGVIRSVKQAR